MSNTFREVAAIAFYNEKGEILFQDRTGISKYGEERSFFGGGIDLGESPEEAVMRECKEELNFDLKKFIFLGKIEHKFLDKLYIRHLFTSKINIPVDKLTILEGSGANFFSVTQARKLKGITDMDREIDLVEKFMINIHILGKNI